MNSLIIETATNSFITFRQLLDRLDILATSATPGLLAVTRQSLKRYNAKANPIYVVENISFVGEHTIPPAYASIDHVVKVVPNEATGYSADIEVVGTLNRQLLNQRWKDVRSQRDFLLSKVDWVESSTAVTDKCKQSIKSYKQLLRDLPALYEYPDDVGYPDIPPIVYKKTVKASSNELTEEEMLEYKASSNMNFISNWKKFNFTKDRQVVELLSKTYA